MSTLLDTAKITYPQSDGQSMADNTKQFRSNALPGYVKCVRGPSSSGRQMHNARIARDQAQSSGPNLR